MLAIICFFECQLQTSKHTPAPAAMYCLVFLSVIFGPQGTLLLQQLGIVWSLCLSISGLRGHSGSSCLLFSVFVYRFWASGDTLAQAVGYRLVSISRLRGHSGSSCWILSGLLALQLQALGDTLAPAVAWSRCLSISGFRGHSASSCRVLSISFSVSFKPQGTLRFFFSSVNFGPMRWL